MHHQHSAVPLAQVRIIYQWMRFEQLDQWWHWLVLAAIACTFLAFVVYWYRRDAREHFRSASLPWLDCCCTFCNWRDAPNKESFATRASPS
jgi:hypothetical protein